MKILFLTDQLYLHGGVEKVLSHKANFFAEKNDEVTIITTEQKNETPVYFLSNNIKLIDLNINYKREKSYFHPDNLILAIKHYKKLKQKIKKLNPDIIISSNYSFDYYFLPFIYPKIPKIKEYHSTRFKENKNLTAKEIFLNTLSYYIEKKYHQIVVLNESEKQYFKCSNVSVIPNPVVNIQYKFSIHSKVLIAAGRLSPVKNFDELIEIANIVFSKVRDWQLHIYGDNYCGTREKLQKKISEYGLQEYIKIFSATPKFSEILDNSGIYVMTSLQECFPMVLLESLGKGIPIISYDVPYGPKYIVADKNYLIKNNNRGDFAEKLLFLMNNSQERQSYSQKSFIASEKFSLDKIMTNWQNLFNKLISV